MAFVTQDLSAVIRKDSLVTGEVFLDLVFPREPGETVADGTILKGRGSAGDLVSLAGLALPKDPKQFLETLGAAFVAVDPAKNGSVVFYLNWVCLIVAALVTVALVLDFLIRMPQGRERERSTPHILRETWTLFCLMLVLRFFLTVFRLLVGSGVLDADLLNVLHIGAVDLADLLKQEWPYWLLAIVLITIRFKFDLLTRVRDRSS
jgi:NADH:ubiquinone oxidoreductase subunit 5 (subunit L)/multisubunit Na+/H+ antiporter MnhA subunit